MDVKEAKEAFLSRSPIVWIELLTEKEYEFPKIEALITRFVRGEGKPILQIEVLDKSGCTMIINPKQARKKG